MALTLHSVSTRHLRGALALASWSGSAAAVLLRDRLGYELLVAAAWDLAVLIFIGAMIGSPGASTRPQMIRKVRHRAPSSFLVGCTAFCAALFGIYALMLLIIASGDIRRAQGAAAGRGVPHHRAVLEPRPSAVRAGVREALLSRSARPRRTRLRPAAWSFPGGHLPEYSDFLLLLVHHRRGLPDRRRRHLGTADAAAWPCCTG